MINFGAIIGETCCHGNRMTEITEKYQQHFATAFCNILTKFSDKLLLILFTSLQLSLIRQQSDLGPNTTNCAD